MEDEKATKREPLNKLLQIKTRFISLASQSAARKESLNILKIKIN